MKNKQVAALTNRNIKLYFRDIPTVFFSLLSMLIIIALLLFFLGDSMKQSIEVALQVGIGKLLPEQYKEIDQLVFYWSCGGILSVNSVTVAIGAYSALVKDQTSGKVNSIYTAPISKKKVALSYILAAWIISVMME